MKPSPAVIIPCLVTASAAPTWTGTGPPDVVRRSDTWLGSRDAASLNQAQVEQIGKDIQSNLTTTIQLITQVSKEEPQVNPPFQDTIKALQSIMQAVGGAMLALAKLKGGKA